MARQPGTSAGGSTQQYNADAADGKLHGDHQGVGDRFRDDHQRNGQCHIHHRIASGHAYIRAGRWQLYLSANGKHLDGIIGSDDLLHDEWINAHNQFNGIQWTYHGERERDVKGLRYQERLLRQQRGYGGVHHRLKRWRRGQFRQRFHSWIDGVEWKCSHQWYGLIFDNYQSHFPGSKRVVSHGGECPEIHHGLHLPVVGRFADSRWLYVRDSRQYHCGDRWLGWQAGIWQL